MAEMRFCISVLARPILAFFVAMPITGRSRPAKMAMMAITTSSSINVKPAANGERFFMSLVLDLRNGAGKRVRERAFVWCPAFRLFLGADTLKRRHRADT